MQGSTSMALSALTESIGASGDDLITKFTSYLVPDHYATSHASSPTLSGAQESYSSSNTPVLDGIQLGESHTDKDAASRAVEAIPGHSVDRPVNDWAFSSGPQKMQEKESVAQNAFRFKDGMYSSQHSGPQDETKSDQRKNAASPASPRKPAPRPDQPRRTSSVDDMLTTTRPVLARLNALRSASDPGSIKASADSKSRRRDSPLKSCFKSRAKSDTVTPRHPLQKDTADAQSPPLSRSKTVDFKRNSPERFSPSPGVAATPESSNGTATRDDDTSSRRANEQRRMVSNYLPIPNTTNTIKSSVADPAITRTDVHVIAITPSWNAHDIVDKKGPHLATPTMQIIETRRGKYEVVWDDVPPEPKIRARRRRSSSASHSLKTITSGGRRSLERINSKLTGWSKACNSASGSFVPTVVVFPDDDGRAMRLECALGDQEDLPLMVPPNSQVTSVTSSCRPSRPASRSLTRTASSNDTLSGAAVQARHRHDVHDRLQGSDESFSVSSPEVQRKGRRNKYPAMVRHLSKLEEADSNFRGHRDSVTIAHARLIRSRKVSPEALEPKDSYIMAKKQRRSGDNAMLAESPSYPSKDSSIETTSPSVPEVSLPVVKEHAAQALKNSSPTSILRPAQHVADQQHIRIVE